MGTGPIVDYVDPNEQNSVETLVKDLEEATAVGDGTTGQSPDGNPVKDKPKPAERPEYIEEKYWTGNLEESLAAQHKGFRDLQSKYGRMANDLGTQRQLTDQLIGLKNQQDLGQDTRGNAPEAPKPLPKLTASSLLERPNEAISELLEAHEERVASRYEQRIAGLEAQLNGVVLKNDVPDLEQLINDPNWHEWLAADPDRAHLAQYAANGDSVIANRLISEYRTSQGTPPDPTPREGGSGEEAADLGGDNVDGVTAVALESAAAGETQKGTIYSRAALMRLKVENPDAYESPRFQDEILKAYAEGRVR